VNTQGQAPLWEALLNYRQKRLHSWHTPGHKDGAYTAPVWRQTLGEAALALYLTEVPGLDNLAHPAGVIQAAQDQAAAFYGAARTFFLVNGATAGLMAVILATCRPGAEVLLPRYAHRAVFNGLILSGARPVYLETEWLAAPALPLGVSPAALARAIKAHPRARLLLLVHPTYEGIVPRSAELIAIAHEHGLAVLADAAHGAHFGLDPSLPPSPLALGADYVSMSTHKTMGALTQAAMLHLGPAADSDGVAAALNLLQTTSPSYLLLASLDAARLLAEEHGRGDWGRAAARAGALRRQLAAAGMPCLEPDGVTGAAAAGLDVTRVLLPAASLGMSGPQAAAVLRAAGHEVELAAPEYILLIINPGDSAAQINSLREALLALPQAGKPAFAVVKAGQGQATAKILEPRAVTPGPPLARGKGETPYAAAGIQDRAAMPGPPAAAGKGGVLATAAGFQDQTAAPGVTAIKGDAWLDNACRGITFSCRVTAIKSDAGAEGACYPSNLPRQVLSPRQAWLAPHRQLPLPQAAGRIAAELIAPCPPGLALVVPGEVLSEDIISRLISWRGPAGRVLVVDERRLTVSKGAGDTPGPD
jgi:arginine/lysine/ornithine decarboxylase